MKEPVKRFMVSVELPGSLYYDLEDEANQSHISKSDVIRNALFAYIKQQSELREFFNRYPTFDAYRNRMEE